MEPGTQASSVTERPERREGARGELRGQLHGMWASVAASWGEHADYADTRGAAITAELLRLAAPRPGKRVLELACGAGGVGIAAARLVGPAGEVVLSDVAAAMTTIAGARAAELGLANVRTLTLDLDDLAQPDQTYDVVLCREGLMFAFDPAHAVAEIRRVLRPGGRAAVAVWGPRARNPWLGVVFDAVAAQLGAPVPPPGVPGPFALDDPGRLGRLFAEAGLADVVVTEVSTPLRDTSFDAWLTRTSSLAGPLAKRLAALPEDARRQLRARLSEAVRPYRTPTGLEFPGVSLLAAGRRASPRPATAAQRGVSPR
jgi:SAM-dependent methyltransferase